MSVTPSKMMFNVWGICILLWVIFPFNLVEKHISVVGVILFLFFYFAFFIGCWSTSIQIDKPKLRRFFISGIKLRNATIFLKFFSAISSLLLFLSLKDRNLFNLTESYQVRSDQAEALLNGLESSSSIFFQVAFLLYPCGYIFIVLHLIYSKKINYLSILIFGFLPIVLAMLVMGGRFPILYSFAIAFFAFRLRKSKAVELGHNTIVKQSRAKRKNIGIYLLIAVILLVALYYFSIVFFVRAESLGGSKVMFAFAEQVWGIKFDGFLSGALFSLFGSDGTFLLFIFSWYAIQGFVMTNFIFTHYDGPLQLGSYGIDIFSAIFRRLSGSFVTDNFSSLLEIGTYGFLPSAFGSLFVDFGYLGIIVCFIWGRWATIVHKKNKIGDIRNMILMPFMLSGILFSLINTPFGFTNGFITHIWLFLTYYLIKPFRYKRF